MKMDKDMVKKVLAIGIPVLLLAGFCLFLVLRRPMAAKSNKLVNSVPASAAFFVKFNQPAELKTHLNNSEVWKAAQGHAFFSGMDSIFSITDSVFMENEDLALAFQNSEMIISAHLLGKDKAGFVFYLDCNFSSPGTKKIQAFLEQSFQKGNVATRKYENTKIFSITVPNGPFYVCYHRHFLFLSKSSLLVEEVVRQVNSDHDLDTDPLFQKVSRTEGQHVHGNVYINHEKFPAFISMAGNDKAKPFLLDFVNFANWTELDINFDYHSWLLNGFTYANDTISRYVKVFEGQAPRKIKVTEVLPAPTNAFLYLGLSDFQLFFNKVGLYKTRGASTGNERVKAVNSAFDIDISSFLSRVMEDELCLAYTRISGLEEENNTFLVAKVKSKSIAEEELQQLLLKVTAKSSEEAGINTTPIAIDSRKGITAYHFPLPSVLDDLIGNIVPEGKFRYFCFIDNYLVFAPATSSLKEFAHFHVTGNSLQLESSFSEVYKSLSTRANVYFYCNIQESGSWLAKLMAPGMAENFSPGIKKMKQVQSVAYQLTAEDGAFYNNAIIKYSEEVLEKPHTVWETLLEAPVEFKPAFVVNHDTRKKEVFVQDKAHNIYLINESGRVLWKRAIDGKIMSEVYQVDRYKNGKLQFLFNTGNKLYLVDRNGNNVERFPVELRVRASNGIALFDYEDDKNYRIFVACEDKNVHVYDIEGNTVPGWEFEGTDNPVYNPVQHFRVEGKDYIVLADRHKIYILDRKGNERVRLGEHFSRSLNGMFALDLQEKAENHHLVTTDTEGNVIFVYFDGTVKRKEIKNYSGAHRFIFNDVNSDGLKDFVFLDSNRLEVYKQSKTKIFEYSFNHDSLLGPIYFDFSAKDKKLGVACINKSEIFLLNANGEPYKGFPLIGTSAFSIGRFDNSYGRFNLIVGGMDKFLYNYSVN